MHDPEETYSRLLAERQAEIAAREARHRRLGYYRLAAFLAAGAIVWLALAGSVSILWVLAPAAAFAALIVIHERLLAVLERRRRAVRFYEKGLARLEGSWAGTGDTGERFLDPAHPYAQDLDLFGKGSLFELLSTARTHIGEETLAGWLLSPADPVVVRSRQEAVEELRPRVDLREDLAVLAEEAHTGVNPGSLAEWGESPPLLTSRSLRVKVRLATALGAIGAICLMVVLAHMMGALPLTDLEAGVARDLFLLAIVVNGWFLHKHKQEFGAVAGAVENAAHQLRLLSEVLFRLERERFKSPLLAALEESLRAEGQPPSARIARLNRLMDYLDSRDHALVHIAEIFILWTPHVAFKLEDWRRTSGPAVRRWVTAAGEMEALCSLASHAFEHPADPFPEFVQEGPLLEAQGIAHPLLAESKAVRNDVSIGGPLRLIVVSGSNMSGKSTLLRTLGVNAVLAQAGAPVRAARLRLSPLAVGASIRVNDSLQGGVSRFYAEILRLRQILDLTSGGLPVLFLIDEFLHGTNSHDRRIGAEALVRGLVDRGAVGLITTHDLALAYIADALGGRAVNVHFEDRVEDGGIHFDYVMRPGVVRKSNAIELMRSVGLVL
jgi:CBS domain-containing protein